MNDYRVRGTVRSAEKGEYLKKLFDGVGEFEYVIVEDIAKVSSSDRAKHCDAAVELHLQGLLITRS